MSSWLVQTPTPVWLASKARQYFREIIRRSGRDERARIFQILRADPLDVWRARRNASTEISNRPFTMAAQVSCTISQDPMSLDKSRIRPRPKAVEVESGSRTNGLFNFAERCVQTFL